MEKAPATSGCPCIYGESSVAEQVLCLCIIMRSRVQESFLDSGRIAGTLIPKTVHLPSSESPPCIYDTDRDRPYPLLCGPVGLMGQNESARRATEHIIWEDPPSDSAR